MVETGEPTIDGVNVDAIRDYLEEASLVFAVLFGSHARGSAHDTSDVDIALRFPSEMDAYERFTRRNRIDADLQEYADGFVDVSDIESLPLPVAVAALRDGIVLVGDERAVTEYKRRVESDYDERATERERREFIDRLARGDG